VGPTALIMHKNIQAGEASSGPVLVRCSRDVKGAQVRKRRERLDCQSSVMGKDLLLQLDGMQSCRLAAKRLFRHPDGMPLGHCNCHCHRCWSATSIWRVCMRQQDGQTCATA
jgi:hypothetical protein